MYDMKPYLEKIDRVIAQGPYQANWASLSAFRVPKWYQQGKFGIFIHWGVYSVPAFGNEWYPRNMYMQGTKEFEHHREMYGPHKEFGYKDFVPMFTAPNFDAEKWAELFQAAGARYVVPVAEHHDGFQMYKSEISHWNAYEMGPKRDVLGELKASIEKRGMQLGASSHRVEHWFFMGHGRKFDSDVKEPLQRGDLYWPAMAENVNAYDLFSEPVPTKEFMEDWLVRTCELVDKYQPKVLYFDWWIEHSAMKPYLQKAAAYYYNRGVEWGTEVAINYKHDAFFFGTAVPDVERGQFAEMKPYFWQTDTSVSLNSWCYTENNQFRPYGDLIRDLVDIVSKNGGMLLNVGPKPDGTIAKEDEEILRGIGAWLGINGEAIYDTQPWRMYGEGPTKVQDGQFTDAIEKHFTEKDFRFTSGAGCLYVIAMGCAEDGVYRVQALGERDASHVAHFHGIITEAELLGTGKVEWTRTENELILKTNVKTDLPLVFKLTIL